MAFNYQAEETSISNGSEVDRQVIDPGALERLHRLGGRNLIVRMIDLFITHAEPVLAKAIVSFEAGDLEAVERAAHSLKSSAANVGAIDMRALAEEIEEKATEGDKAMLQGLLGELGKAFARARSVLEREKERS